MIREYGHTKHGVTGEEKCEKIDNTFDLALDTSRLIY
jgi:hypothetical protein